jgi:hypothetical protein
MMLLTCATHLIAVTIAQHYWEYKLLAAVRILVTTGVFLATGLMMSNQNVDPKPGFPTEIPDPLPATFAYNATNNMSSALSLTMFMPAACFEEANSKLIKALDDSFALEGSKLAFFSSVVDNNKIHGWSNYLIMLLFFVFSTIIAIGRFLKGDDSETGDFRSKRIVPLMLSITKRFEKVMRFMYMLYAIYLAGGIGIASWTILISGMYIFGLRKWANDSGWIDTTGNNGNPENDPTSFGQLVPLCLIALSLFTFLQIWSDQLRRRHTARKVAAGKATDGSDEKPGKPSRSATNESDDMTAVGVDEEAGTGLLAPETKKTEIKVTQTEVAMAERMPPTPATDLIALVESPASEGAPPIKSSYLGTPNSTSSATMGMARPSVGSVDTGPSLDGWREYSAGSGFNPAG